MVFEERIKVHLYSVSLYTLYTLILSSMILFVLKILLFILFEIHAIIIVQLFYIPVTHFHIIMLKIDFFMWVIKLINNKIIIWQYTNIESS